jgi:lysophospholipase L1-like esterase
MKSALSFALAWALACLILSPELGAQTTQSTQPSDKVFKSLPYQKGDITMIVGDSIGGPHDIDPMLSKALPAMDLLFMHASIGTTDIRDAWGRMERDLIRGDLGDREVAWYVIMFGGNDAGRPDLINGGYEAYYRKVITTLKRRTRAHIIPVCTIPVGTGLPVMTGFAETLKKLGGEYGLKVVDLYNPSIDFIKKNGQAAFAKDTIHAGKEGHEFMAKEFIQQLGAIEDVTVDLKNGEAKGSTGCGVENLKAGDTTVTLRNQYDFSHPVAVVLKNNDKALDVLIDGKKAEITDGRILVTLPGGIGWVTDDLKEIQKLSGKGELYDAAQAVLDDVAASKTIKLTLGSAAPAVATQPAGDCHALAFGHATGLANKILAPKGADGKNAKLMQAAESFIQQFCDLRLNIPVTSMKNWQRSEGVFPGVRDISGRTLMGDTAVKPREKFQAIFTNFDCPSVSGTISVKLPAKGWQVKVLGPVEFKGLPQGRKFVCEFELTGEEITSYEGDMVVTAEFDVDGIKLRKEETFKLFAPWLGIGAFCDKKELEAGTYTEKIATVYEPETKIDPKATYKRYDGTELKWQPFRSMYGYAGIERAGEVCYSWNLPGNAWNVILFKPWPSGVKGQIPAPEPIYIARWVYSPSDRDVTLLPVFTSRAAKLWINGKIVVDVNNTDEKQWAPGDVGMNWQLVNSWLPEKPKTVQANLKKGWNTVLYKLLLGTSMTGVDKTNLLILDKDRKPMPDLLGSCSPQE